MVVVPPLTVVRAWLLMPRAPGAVTAMLRVPPLTVKPSFTLMPLVPVVLTLTFSVPSSTTIKSSLAMSCQHHHMTQLQMKSIQQ
jgi:hypothetical protein